ncbi:ABC transporter permease [Gardnerella greenwoodii]|uniref:ABC-type dipeptide/oligopeptide/nickel transport systems permease component n=2 Tax=Gardnerella greenwoodii TaxID=2914925 RepID=I4M8D6_9BIFI|nr:ABC transporter permease [Gardnerella greenwoodii]EIK85476.1 ABC-type dipeptide/oligopeptide/nickel transport systems permease component [Gardnerella greenwoodii 00703Dmash]MDF0753725.1 ABC transporter permease [Gardnerella greenwoodii]PMC42727.1 ABC transporter permease [Gardnerella greenwoodii]
MFRTICQRLLLFIAALFCISAAVFLALRVLPGDVAQVMAGINSPHGKVEQLRAELGLNKPLFTQYADWLLGVLRGDFGVSVLTGRPVVSMILSRATITFPLIFLGLAIALAIGIPLGCFKVTHEGKLVQVVSRFTAISAGSVPALWGGMLLILLFGKGVGVLGLLPTQGFPTDGWSDFSEAFLSLLLPAITVGIIVGSSFMRYTSAVLENIANSEIAAEAMACGMTRKQVVWRVGLRLALPQLVSVIGLTFAHMVMGVMVIENLFSLPGMGMGLVRDVGLRDLIAVQGELFMLAALFLLIGFAVDIAHRLLDPRLAR